MGGMTASTRHANHPAILPADQRAWLRIGLLEHYEADPVAMAALNALVVGTPSADAIAAVAHDLGLDRLRGDEVGNLAGADLIRRWVDEWHQFGPAPLTTAGGRSGAVPMLAGLEPPRYDPTRERRGAYLARVGRYVAEVETSALASGFVFFDTAQVKTHLRWLFLRMRHGLQYPEIATRDQLDGLPAASAGAVGLAVRRVARLAGADV